MGLTGLTMESASASPGLQILADLSFVLACFASCFAVLAVVLRFAARRLPSLAGLRDSAYGMYLVHYLFVVWLQFALLGIVLPAVIKGAVVFGCTLFLSRWTVAALRRLPSAGQIIGAERAKGAARGAVTP
jgi:surface polysaccharide O-acyltransferase-like enzyme